MAEHVTCDVCGQTLRAVGFKVVWAGARGAEYCDIREVVGDYCSAVCLQRKLSAAGAKRPAFGETKELLDRLASEHDSDERAMVGEFDNALDVEAALPYTPPAPFLNGSQRNHALAAADAAAVLAR